MTQEKSRPGRDKKPYHRPRLTAFGDVRAITQTVANFQMLDGRNPRAPPGPKNTSEVA